MSTALVKVLVGKFYERHAGFFLFIFFLMFGVVESTQLVSYHLSLIAGVIASPVFLFVVCLLWLLYLLKCLQFTLSAMASPENEFIFRLNLLPASMAFRILLFALFMMDIPVLLYAALIVILATANQHFIVASVIVLFHLFFLSAVSWIVVKRINSPHINRARQLKLPGIRWPGPVPLPVFYLGYLGQQAPMIVLTKIFSIVCLVGFLRIPLDAYDNRLVFLGILFGLAAHIVVVFEFRKFEDRYLAFMRGFPFSLPRRFSTPAIVYFVLLIPEAAVLFFNKIPIPDIGIMLIQGTGFLVASHFFLYRKNDMDVLIQWVLMLFLVSFMVVLWRLCLPEAILLWMLAYIYLTKYFYRYEASDS